MVREVRETVLEHIGAFSPVITARSEPNNNRGISLFGYFGGFPPRRDVHHRCPQAPCADGQAKRPSHNERKQ
jgi:hypothetical protein